MSSRLLLRLTRQLSQHSNKHMRQQTQYEPLLHYEFVPSSSNEHNQHLLVLHGIMGYGKLYRHLATNPKTQSHFNSYLLDFRNHGQSFWSDQMGVQDMARDVKKWLDAHNFPQRSLTAVGHSMGARVLVSLTQQYPELESIIKKVVLVDAAAHSYEGYPFIAKSMEFFDKLAKLDFSKSDQEIFDYIKSISVNAIQESMVRLSLNLEKRQFLYNLQAIIKEYLRVAHYSCKEVSWKGDVFVVKALKSHYIQDHSKEDFRRLYKGLKKIVDVDCYHNVHLERPYDIIKLLHE